MSTSKVPQVDKRITQRLPAPTLFVGPPSRNASNTSLLPAPKEGNAPDALSRQRSFLGGQRNQASSTKPAGDSSLLSPEDGAGTYKGRQPQQLSPAERAAEQQSNERTDALWAEMQNTLEEVELKAAGGSHVFGRDHSKALDELRTAQIALAQAWAKSEAEEEKETRDGKKDDKKPPEKSPNTADVLAADRADKFGAGKTPAKTTKTQLEEETENDIQLARERRETNDRYFQRVNKGVLDVVAKLEQVAKAMKGVEMESREIWDDKDSPDSASVG